MISFCTWVRGRRHQLEQTLETNLQRSEGYDCEFVIVDEASPDRLEEYIRSVYCSRLRYFRMPERPLHFSVMKNTAHRLANGEILVNLDADNVIGPRYCEWLMGHLGIGKRAVMHNWRRTPEHNGTCGRVAVSRQSFYALGGYDEDLLPAGYQDLDFIARARAAGHEYILDVRPEVAGESIANSTADKMRYISSERSWDHLNGANHHTSQTNIAAGRLVANYRQPWVRALADDNRFS